MFRYALEVPLRMQWDPDSRLPYPDPGTAPGNCGPTAVAQVAEFYRDQRFGIYATRRLVVASNKLSTSVVEQRDMLRRRGVPSQLKRPTIAELHKLLASGRRPIIIGMRMGLVPDAIAGHDFQLDHAVTLRANASGGFLVADGNFSRRTNRLDKTNGRRFYPDWVVKRAYYDAGKWALVPDRDKVVSGPAPHPSPQPNPTPPSTALVADGDPAPMRYRTLVDQATGALPRKVIKPGKPVRKGATTAHAALATTSADTVIRPWGVIPKEDLPAAERQYGDVFLTNWYAVNGEHVGYVKAVDLK